MILLLVLVLVLVPSLSGASAHGQQTNLETLMENVLVLRIPGDGASSQVVPLTCGEAHQDQSVFWKKDGQELDPPLRGNQVRVQVEEMKGGNYTCHLGPGGKYLNHTLVLVQLDPDNRKVILEERSPKEFIHCSSPNYKGTFHCTWTRSEFRREAAMLLVKAERDLEQLPCELDADGSGVRCHNSTCGVFEEKQRVALTLLLHSAARLEDYSRDFFIRDIVQPGKVSDLRLVEGKSFTWSEPSSWDRPCSYFKLQFQVKVLGHGQTCSSDITLEEKVTENKEFEVSVKNKRYVFCVRAQDKFTNGPWSHWSRCTVNKHQAAC